MSESERVIEKHIEIMENVHYLKYHSQLNKKVGEIVQKLSYDCAALLIGYTAPEVREELDFIGFDKMCEHFDIYMYGYDKIDLKKLFTTWGRNGKSLFEAGFFNGIQLFTLKKTADKYNPIWDEYKEWAIENGMPTTTSTNNPVEYKDMIDSLDIFLKVKENCSIPLKHNKQQTNTNTKQINKMTEIINDPIEIAYQAMFRSLAEAILNTNDEGRMVTTIVKQCEETFSNLMSKYIEYTERKKTSNGEC